MKEAITKPLKGQEKTKAKAKTDARKAVSRREGVPPCSCPRQTDHAACLSSLVWRNSAGERMPRALWG